jgi:hypothetical protein
MMLYCRLLVLDAQPTKLCVTQLPALPVSLPHGTVHGSFQLLEGTSQATVTALHQGLLLWHNDLTNDHYDEREQ